MNGPRLERVLERLVDTPVRGFVYEAAGTAPEAALAEGSRLVTHASTLWRIPLAVVETQPADGAEWAREMARAAGGLLGLR